jgi:hypothetical protein
MKFHVIIEGDYEVADAELDAAYDGMHGDKTPEMCAAFDANSHPSEILGWLEGTSVTITPL